MTLNLFNSPVLEKRNDTSKSLGPKLLTWFSKGPSLAWLIETEDHNNFKLIRLLASSLVIFSHSYIISKGATDSIHQLTNGAIDGTQAGVSAFFFLSGLLVTQSLENSPSIRNFIWKRFLRLYPAAWFAIFFTAFILGPFLSTLPAGTYFSSLELYRYLISLSIVFLKFDLPGVFEKAITPGVNGSLWSLSLEWKLYFLLTLFGLFRFPLKKLIVPLGTLFLILLYAGSSFSVSLVEYLPRNYYVYLAYVPHFVLGSMACRFRYKISVSPSWLTGGLIAIFVAIKFQEFRWLVFFYVPVFTLYFASLLPNYIRKFTPRPDLSYGYYVFAFPIQQTLNQFMDSPNPFLLFILTMVTVLPFALLSWYQIEKKALTLKHLIK